MLCQKCNGLMTYTEIYTEDCVSTKALRCMNCGRHEYTQPELRILPVTEEARNRFKKFAKEATCQNPDCGKLFMGFRKKYCSQRCKDLVSVEKAREKRVKQG